VFNFNQALSRENVFIEPFNLMDQLNKNNDFKLSLTEVRSQMNITIDIMLQMPSEYVSLLQDYDILCYEDLSAYKTRLRIFSAQMLTENTINLVISIPNYDVNTFKQRCFQLCFVQKLPEELFDKT
jgi:hypothetical protein